MVKKGFVILVSITLSLFIFGGYTNNDLVLASQDELNVEQVVKNALQEQWSLLLDENSSFTSFDQTSSKINEFIIQEKSKVNRHYLEPAQRAGFKYTNVTVDPKIDSLILDNQKASVELTAYIEYESKYTNSNDPITTGVIIPYSIELIKNNGTWYVIDITYFDVFSKKGESNIESSVAISYDTQITSDNGIEPLGYFVYYDRNAAVSYANTWVYSFNPKYKSYGNDCANFVSQSFYEGGTALMAYNSPYVWWYNFNGTSSTSDDTHSTSWSVAHDQAYNLSRNTDSNEMRGAYVSSASDLEIGDSIYYDFDNDGILDHSAIVVDIINGQPYVNYHSGPADNKYWDLGASTTKFLHVTDFFYVN